LRNVDAAIVQAAVERIAALLTRDGEWTVSALSALTASRRSIVPMIWRVLSEV